MNVTIDGVEYEMTATERRAYDELVNAGVDAVTALQIAKDDFVDIDPEPVPA